MFSPWRIGMVAVCVVILSSSAVADVVDFESGFGLEAVGVVITPTNTVTFSVGANIVGPGTGPGFVAGVGDLPGVAFGGAGGIDQVFDPSVAGSFFLTDEFLPNPPNALELNYFIEFDLAVASLSLDLYDFLADGGGAVGDTATLIVYSDSFLTTVGLADYTIVGGEPDGNITHLAIPNPSAPIRSAALILDSSDEGTGIDNITFSLVPIPDITPFRVRSDRVGARRISETKSQAARHI
jgi:hypothetical protein